MRHVKSLQKEEPNMYVCYLLIVTNVAYLLPQLFGSYYVGSQSVNGVCKKSQSIHVVCISTIELNREDTFTLGCVQIDSRVKQKKIERQKTREHERRDDSIQIREEDIEQSLQLSEQRKGSIYFSFQMKSTFVVFFQMGFHVKYHVNVQMMNVFMSH